MLNCTYYADDSEGVDNPCDLDIGNQTIFIKNKPVSITKVQSFNSNDIYTVTSLPYPYNSIALSNLSVYDHNAILSNKYIGVHSNMTITGKINNLYNVYFPVANHKYMHGYIKTNNIYFDYSNQWRNGSTLERVFDSNGDFIGNISDYGTATPLYRSKYTNQLFVIYKTIAGFVNYNGKFNKF